MIYSGTEKEHFTASFRFLVINLLKTKKNEVRKSIKGKGKTKLEKINRYACV